MGLGDPPNQRGSSLPLPTRAIQDRADTGLSVALLISVLMMLRTNWMVSLEMPWTF